MLRRLLSYFRRSLENPQTPINSWTVASVLAGVAMDPDTALQHLPIFAAVNRISTDISILDITVKRMLDGGGFENVPQHWLNRLLMVSPDGVRNASRWRQAQMGHVLTRGNAYAEIVFDGAGRAAALHGLPPGRITPRIVDGKVFYEYNGPTSNGEKMIPAWKILHFAGLGWDGLEGYAPITMARETLGLGRAADLFGAAFFGNAARPSGALTHPKKLSDIARKNLRESFENRHSGPMATGRIALLEEGLQWEKWTIDPHEAQFLETRKFSVVDVARLFGLPPNKISDYSESHMANIEEANIDYLQTTLLGWCVMWQNEIQLKLLDEPTSEGLCVRHNFDTMLQANAAARASYATQAIQWGWASRNAIARREGFAPVPGGDRPLVPLNMVMIGEDGNPIPLNTPPAAAPQANPVPPASLMPASAPQAAPPTMKQLDAVGKLVTNELQRSLRRESAAMKRAASKPEFRETIKRFYAEHRALLRDMLAPSLHALEAIAGQTLPIDKIVDAWCARSEADLLDVEAVTTSDQRETAVESLISAATWNERPERALEVIVPRI